MPHSSVIYKNGSLCVNSNTLFILRQIISGTGVMLRNAFELLAYGPKSSQFDPVLLKKKNELYLGS